jgi:hypothetical protein
MGCLVDLVNTWNELESMMQTASSASSVLTVSSDMHKKHGFVQTIEI